MQGMRGSIEANQPVIPVCRVGKREDGFEGERQRRRGQREGGLAPRLCAERERVTTVSVT
eukprot:2441857-Rhodomonas_salina.1